MRGPAYFDAQSDYLPPFGRVIYTLLRTTVLSKVWNLSQSGHGKELTSMAAAAVLLVVAIFSS